MKIISWQNLASPEGAVLLKRKNDLKSTELIQQTQAIMEAVKVNGDDALLAFTGQWDKAKLTQIKVTSDDFGIAQEALSQIEKRAIMAAISRIQLYHQQQVPENIVLASNDGIRCERQARPIERVGLYVPAGTAPLISTVMMLAIPARIAGCLTRILCTPPNPSGEIDPAILFAAKACGIEDVYKVGGAQAIAAMAYGTQTIPKVDKIYGPGNAWVTQAKMQCAMQGAVSIDIPAGPSELLVIADQYANPQFVAADLLSQAEHDSEAQVLLLTPDRALAEKVVIALQDQVALLPKKAIAESALAKGLIILVKSIEQAIEISNQYAPEHLSLQIENPESVQAAVQSAGTVFVGKYSAESMGDYITGANHVLPTAGFARSISGLSVTDFMKWVGFQQVTVAGLKKWGPIAEQLATMEGMLAHKQAITYRLQEVLKNVTV
jgi:histidinol dehydrogenase